MPSTDPECDAKGIPPHLHRLGRDADSDFGDSGELLYRRIPAASETRDLSAEFQFNRMSVNRDKYCGAPDDVLWNDVAGGRYTGYGVISFPVGALEESWEHPVESKAFTLKPEHAPTVCNYPHTEVVAFESNPEGGTKALDKIKPPSVKLQIREHMQPFLKLADSGR